MIGPGGSGKTRLATETARTLLDGLPDGAWLVELAATAPTATDGDVARAALTGLGLRDALLGGPPHAEPLDRLVAAVRDREALLVLDNCEHVVEAAARFAHRVLGECRRLRILATSREPLGITGEALWQAEPLTLPPEDPDGPDGGDPDAVDASPAVRLLRDRAGAVRRDLTADAGTRAALARICRALDGMPLAIELAAARLRTMSPEQLASRLDDRFRLLTGGSRTALPRHRTLRAVVDWSWELLDDAERAVLRRLSVFAGPAALDAAEQACAGGPVAADQVLELLTALTEKSLLTAEGDAAPATGCSARSRSTPGTGSPRRARRSARAAPTWPTSPNSPRPRSRTCAAPANSPGWPGCRPGTTTSQPPCAAPSRPVSPRRRCGSRPARAGTGGSAATRPRASSCSPRPPPRRARRTTRSGP